MFKCLKCNSIFDELPKCHCGYEHEIINGVFQLTDMPNMNTDEEKGDLYTGYDRIGKYYEGRNWLEISDESKQQADYISSVINGGYLLDVGCGTGGISLASALNGDKVLFTDISQVMLELLIEKAKHNGVDMKYVTPMRMNGLDLRFADNSIDVVRCDGMLHLTSNSSKILHEIYRVLKPNGKFIVISGFGKNSDNSIRSAPKELSEKDKETNREYNERLSYWRSIYYKHADGYPMTRYGYKFDEYAECEKIFGSCENIEFYHDTTGDGIGKSSLSNYIYRYKNKGFSDQQNIPDDVNIQASEAADRESRLKYGDDFDQIERRFYNSDGFYIKVFTK